MVGTLVSNVERFVRWVYPGLLLPALLQLSRKDSVIDLIRLPEKSGDGVQVFALTTGVIVSSFVIYMLYRYLFHEPMQYVLFLSGWSDVAVYVEKKPDVKKSASPLFFGTRVTSSTEL